MLMRQTLQQTASILSLLMLSSSVLSYEAPVESRTGAPVSPSEAYTQPYVDDGNTRFQPIATIDGNPMPVQQSVYADEEPKSAMLDKIAILEQNVRELRGLVEEQGHVIKRLEKQVAQSHSSPTGHAVADEEEIAPNDTSAKKEIPENTNVTEQKLYQDAFALLRNKQFAQAIPAMNAYLKTYPKGQHAVNAHYWLGEVSLIQGDSKTAQEQFSQIVKEFPSSPKVPDAKLKIGTILADQKKWADAKTQFQDILEKYPESSASKLADQRLQQIEIAGH